VQAADQLRVMAFNLPLYRRVLQRLAGGARWSEAEGLKGNQIRAGHINYVKTESKKNREVPITEKLQAELPYSKKAQLIFKPCYSAFRKAMQRAGIETPAGQLTHVLRHTFAFHFTMNGGIFWLSREYSGIRISR
jgi:integrase